MSHQLSRKNVNLIVQRDTEYSFYQFLDILVAWFYI